MQARQGASATSSPPILNVIRPGKAAFRRIVHYGFRGATGIGPTTYPGGSLGSTNWVWPLTIGLYRVFVADDVAHAGMGPRGVRDYSAASSSPTAFARLNWDWAAPRP
jgi:hypothetical protein